MGGVEIVVRFTHPNKLIYERFSSMAITRWVTA